MRLVVFALVFVLLMALNVLAAGLEITEIDAHVDYDKAYVYRLEDKDRKDSASVSIVNNSKIDVDVLPGSNVTFTIRAENTFTGDKPEIKGAFVTVTIEEIDDGADLDEQSIDFDLNPGDDYRVDVKFPIPLDVDSKTYDTIIEAEGEDRNKTSYRAEVRLKLEVKKQSHDIRITRVLLSPSVVDCSRKARLTAEIMNLGSNEENQVALEFKSANLGINSFDRDISLRSSDEASEEEKTHTKILNIEVPSFFNAGTYPIFVNLYWKNFVLFDQKTANLIVRDCVSAAKPELKQEAKEEPKKEPELVTVVQPKEEKEEQKPEAVTATKEISILDSPLLLSVFLGGLIVVVLAVLVIVGYFKRAKEQ